MRKVHKITKYDYEMWINKLDATGKPMCMSFPEWTENRPARICTGVNHKVTCLRCLKIMRRKK